MDRRNSSGGKGGPILKGPTLLPAPTQSNKRPRVGTPEKVKESQDFSMVNRIQEDMDFFKGKIGTAALGIKTDKIVNLGQCFNEFINGTLVSILERQASTMSDMASKIDMLGKENTGLRKSLEAANEELAMVKQSKDKVEVKSSRKDMEDKVRVANTQFKVMDLDIGTNHEDRKSLIDSAKMVLREKVRADLRSEYDARIKHASIRVMASNTFKRQVDGKDIWTAPHTGHPEEIHQRDLKMRLLQKLTF
jgi:hypothetical protein